MSEMPLSSSEDQSALFAPADLPAVPSASAKPYFVLARKYRPKDFSELKGQDALVRTLTNAFASGRIAHAFMLTGVRGVGKTTTARIIAKGLNCESGPTITPCGTCSACVSIAEGSAVDVLELDAASRTGVDNIRDLIDNVQYAPAQLRFKVYIVDEVHMLSTAAFNALLKTLEEPPPHVKFVFATTEIRKVPVTVLSRCQRFDLRRIEPAVLAAHFAYVAKEEHIQLDDEALALLARAADGSARDGLSLLDQAMARSTKDQVISGADIREMLGLADRHAVIDLLSSILSGSIAEALGRLAELHKSGADAALILQDLLDGVHQLSRCKVLPEADFAAPLGITETTLYQKLAEGFSVPALARAWQVLMAGVGEVQAAPSPMAALEMLIIRLGHIGSLPMPGDLLKKIGQADLSGLTQGATGVPPNPDSRPQARRTGTGGGATLHAVPAAIAAQPQAQQAPQNWRELVALVGEKREMHLYAQLYGAVECQNFAPRHIELYLREGVPQNLMPRLSQLLTNWLGESWMISPAKAPQKPTLSEEDEAKKQSVLAGVATHPLVKAVLMAFPTAKVTAVHEPEPPAPAEEPLNDSADMILPTDDFLED